MSLREIAGAQRECFVDLDDVYLTEQSVELINRRSKVPRGEAPETLGVSECGAGLGVDQLR